MISIYIYIYIKIKYAKYNFKKKLLKILQNVNFNFQINYKSCNICPRYKKKIEISYFLE